MNVTNESILHEDTLNANNTGKGIAVAVLWIIGSLTCIINVIVIMALLKANGLRGNTHRVLVLTLSFSDFLTGVSAILFGFNQMFRNISWSFYLALYAMFVSMSQIFLICIEAYLSAFASLAKKERFFGGRRKYYVILVVWLINLLFYSMFYLSVPDINPDIVSSLSCVSFSIVYLLTISLYIKILHIIRSSKKRIESKPVIPITNRKPEKNRTRESRLIPNIFFCFSNVTNINANNSGEINTNGDNQASSRCINVRRGRSSATETENQQSGTNSSDNFYCKRTFMTGDISCVTTTEKGENNQKLLCYTTCPKDNQTSEEDKGEVRFSVRKMLNNESTKELKNNTIHTETSSFGGPSGSIFTPIDINDHRSQVTEIKDKHKFENFKNISWHWRCTVTIGLILLALTICCVPFMVNTLLFALNVPYISRQSLHYSGMLLLMHALVNPIIYVARFREFRKIFKCLINIV